MHLRLQVEGVVQGVGFRPFVYRLANDLLLEGFVRNDDRGVLIEVAGTREAVTYFEIRMTGELPPLARVDRIHREMLDEAADRSFAFAPPSGNEAFVIQESGVGDSPAPQHTQPLSGVPTGIGTQGRESTSALVPPDIATCDDCIAEMNDPSNRRYRYPFTNCTNCGPRFTIIQSVPYDRARTTMSAFTMCAQCQGEYDNPRDRRFHAQPNACAECGPALRVVRTDKASAERDDSPETTGEAPTTARESAQSRQDDASDAIAIAVCALLEGAIVAIKGVGGYHVACLATSEVAVQRLRERKHRPDKPFAIMVPDMQWARRLIVTNATAASLLQSRERPIVLGRRTIHETIAHNVAPRLHELGVMLPYSPLHQLILQQCDAPLVMTSGNLADEPIAFRDTDALERLGTIADLFLIHNREIETPTDDSVIRVVTVGTEQRPMMLRRSRGYAPTPAALPVAAPVALLACGAELKNSYCVAQGARAWIGPHVGDLGNIESRVAFQHGIVHHEQLFAVTPQLFVHDLHPGYASTQYAVRRAESTEGTTTLAVQHHHAHFAACLAEHGEQGPAGAVILDGTGFGSDGTLWGGELLYGSLDSVERRGHLWPVALPGGEAAIREPWRMACAWLCELAAQTELHRADEQQHERFVNTWCPESFADRQAHEAWNATLPEARVRPHVYIPPIPRLLRGRVAVSAWRSAALIWANRAYSPVTTSAGRLLDALAAICGVSPVVTYEGQAAIELEALADPSAAGSYAIPLLRLPHITCIDARALVTAVIEDVERGEPVPGISARIHAALAEAIAECCTRVFPSGSHVALSGGVFQNALLVCLVSNALTSRGFRPLAPANVPPNDGGIAFGQAAVASSQRA